MISTNPVVQNALRAAFTRSLDNYGKRVMDALCDINNPKKISALDLAFDEANRLKRMLDGDEIVDQAFVDAVNELRQSPRPKF